MFAAADDCEGGDKETDQCEPDTIIQTSPISAHIPAWSCVNAGVSLTNKDTNMSFWLSN